ncbi:unnamed protein product [Acidithrix sp. C25]|nr:unnamed protein product [Acidithrix sp. C25]
MLGEEAPKVRTGYCGWGGIGRSSIQVPSDLLHRKFSKK